MSRDIKGKGEIQRMLDQRFMNKVLLFLSFCSPFFLFAFLGSENGGSCPPTEALKSTKRQCLRRGKILWETFFCPQYYFQTCIFLRLFFHGPLNYYCYFFFC
ncbi:hypothetical protein BDV40DRAFT_106984 [Aspergillus tamarii]|uniref:Uncharacterized protein n=1 Tax=Aspergillus tamarii TaxID=41984 RepID=A0A5N6V1T8_ASPTM|nr:hypothetical protein BDV40DRAFT_106984 [Aspergillus tamarii]